MVLFIHTYLNCGPDHTYSICVSVLLYSTSGPVHICVLFFTYSTSGPVHTSLLVVLLLHTLFVVLFTCTYHTSGPVLPYSNCGPVLILYLWSCYYILYPVLAYFT